MPKLIDDPKVQKVIEKSRVAGFKTAKAESLAAVTAELDVLDGDASALGKALARALKRVKASIRSLKP